MSPKASIASKAYPKAKLQTEQALRFLIADVQDQSTNVHWSTVLSHWVLQHCMCLLH